jgi:hypothetical protein
LPPCSWVSRTSDPPTRDPSSEVPDVKQRRDIERRSRIVASALQTRDSPNAGLVAGVR